MNDFYDNKIIPSSCYVTTPDLMREAERRAISEGTTEAELIERASDKIVENLFLIKPELKSIAIVVGGGNNGSDGLSTAIKLTKKGVKCTVFALSCPKNSENLRLTEEVESVGLKIMPASVLCGKFDIALDCMFGIGLTRKIDGENAEVVRMFNALYCVKVAVDVPSGLDASSGRAFGECVIADYTIALGAIKVGHVLGEGFNYCGQIRLGDIGVEACPVAQIVDKEMVKIPPRKPVSHKGCFGKISVIGGSDTMPGAPLMSYESACAASRSGAGLVRLCVGEDEKDAYKSRVLEQTMFYFPSKDGFIAFSENKLDEIIEWSDVIAIGMGMGNNPDLPKILQYLAQNFTKTLIVDADGLNALAKDLSVIRGAVCKIVLTPHLGEFARLQLGVGQHELEKIKEFARQYGVTLALKSSSTVITDGEKVYINVTGCPSLAKGGSGDVLAGMISAFAVNSATALDATVKACYYFGKCGERVSIKKQSEVSVLASDVIIQQNEIFN